MKEDLNELTEPELEIELEKIKEQYPFVSSCERGKLTEKKILFERLLKLKQQK